MGERNSIPTGCDCGVSPSSGHGHTNRYVIEVTYSRVKAWEMLAPVVPSDQFRHLNSVWWWALGFSNLHYKPLKRLHTVNA